MKEVNGNGLHDIIAQAIEEMKNEQGNNFSLETINLAELQRRTGTSRVKLRKLKKDGFVVKAHGLLGRKAPQTVLTGYTTILDKLLIQGVTNAQVCLERFQEVGYPGRLTTVKDYIASHRFLAPAKRQMVAPQGSQGRRFGVPYSYRGSTARIMRKDDMIYIYSTDLKQLLTTLDVTWSKRDRFYADQYVLPEQPEEFASRPVKTEIVQLPEPEPMLSFEKFNFDKERVG